MHFKYPLVLWALLVLLIPIIVHLFRLRKFVPTSFTNVAMLQRVMVETKKSRSIKKWILLFTRLLLLTLLILAFAQPNFGNRESLKGDELIIYLDNSLSMTLEENRVSLLQESKQNLLKLLPENKRFSLFSNDILISNTTKEEARNAILDIQPTTKQLTLKQIQLKAQELFSSNALGNKRLVLFTDLEDNLGVFMTPDIHYKAQLVLQRNQQVSNTYIDTLYLDRTAPDQPKIIVRAKGMAPEMVKDIKMFQGNVLVGRQPAKADEQGEALVSFPITQKDLNNAKVEIDAEGLSFDDRLYFTLNTSRKAKVLTVNDTEENFLKRLFGTEEFDHTETTSNQLEYAQIPKMDMIVLQGINSYPKALEEVLKSYLDEGGTLVISPPANLDDLTNFNRFLKGLASIEFTSLNPQENRIQKIAFDHPLFNSIFTSRTSNFDFPSTLLHYQLSGITTPLLSFEDNSPFMVEKNNIYLFTAPLTEAFTDFVNHPLVVPSFVQIAMTSKPDAQPYFYTNRSEVISIDPMEQEGMITLEKNNYKFIPLQQTGGNKLEISLGEDLTTEGIYDVLMEGKILQPIAFNFPRNESELNYLNPQNFDGLEFIDQNQLEESEWLSSVPRTSNYWKWFVTFALLIALVELLIQKLL